MSNITSYQNEHDNLNLEQMCQFSIICNSTDYIVTLKKLILHSFVILSTEEFAEVDKIVEAIYALFNLKISSSVLNNCVSELIDEGSLQRPNGTNIIINPETRDLISKNISDADNLEDLIKEEWLSSLKIKYPELSSDVAWLSLRNYLTRAFRRHGIQAVALLDPSVTISSEHTKSLSSLLEEALSESHEYGLRTELKKSISEFFSEIGKYPNRSKYITQLADGAFYYFALAIEPEVSLQLRKNLNPLTLFLDTNFLFGILNLHVHPSIEVSNNLLRAVKKFNLPFTLGYLELTKKEIEHTINLYGRKLRERKWKPSFSQVVINSTYISGIELKYHEQNAKTGIDVNSFLMPYDHFDLLLEEKGITLFPIPESREKESAILESQYRKYLEARGQLKPDNVITHDIKLLDTVRSLRLKSTNSLDAGALLVTCDYSLYKFELEVSRQENRMSCVVLPNIFWQILRPFVPQDIDFERAFAETFAIPEFRTIGSGASQACSKLIAILASYKDLPEKTIMKLLSNKLLIDQLRTIENSKEFQEHVESSIVAENASLYNEKTNLQAQLEQTRIDYIQEKDDREKIEDKVKVLEDKLLYIQNDSSNIKFQYIYLKRYSSIIISLLTALIFEFIIYKFKWNWIINHPMTYLLQLSIIIIIISVISGLITKWEKWFKDLGVFGLGSLFIGFLLSPKDPIVIIYLCLSVCFMFHYIIHRIPWNWLLYHSQTYCLQGAFHVGLISLIIGAFCNSLRFCLTLILIPIGLLIIGKLGGKQNSNKDISI